MKLFIAVGEASGEALALPLLRSLSAQLPSLEVRGIVGPALRAWGVDAVGDARVLGAIGPVEAARSLPEALRLLDRAEAAIADWRPDVVLTVDSPSWMLRLARRARARGFRTVHWVSPQVWAWRPHRVRAVAQAVETLLCLFPFEPEYYRGLPLRAVFVGHPAARLAAHPSPRRSGRVALLPGSRASEVRALWPVFRQVASRLSAEGRSQEVLRAPQVESAWLQGVDAEHHTKVEDLTAEVALVAAGTATLEVALRGIPQVATYRTDPLTWALGRRLVGVKHLALPNLLAPPARVPEHLQDLRAEALVEALAGVRKDPSPQLALSAELCALLAPWDPVERVVHELRYGSSLQV